MFNWRRTLVLGVFFVLVGILYFVVQGTGTCAPQMEHCTSRTLDLTGVLLLLLTGVSMAFGLIVLIRGSRDV
jgi:drug/metabolite transporter (DMT)-like permease